MKKIIRSTAIGPLGVKLVPYHSAEGRNIWSTFLKILCGNMQFTGMEISWAVFVNILNLTKWQNDSLRFFVVLFEIMTNFAEIVFVHKEPSIRV